MTAAAPARDLRKALINAVGHKSLDVEGLPGQIHVCLIKSQVLHFNGVIAVQVAANRNTKLARFIVRRYVVACPRLVIAATTVGIVQAVAALLVAAPNAFESIPLTPVGLIGATKFTMHFRTVEISGRPDQFHVGV